MCYLYAVLKRKDNHIVMLRYVSSILSVVLLSSIAFSQAGVNVQYKSEDDELLNIENIAVADVIDNVNGVYSKVLTEWLNKRIDDDHQWNAIPFSRPLKTDYLEPNEVIKILKETNSQALMTSRVLRGPQGLSYRMTLYVGNQGLPFAQEVRNAPKSDALADIAKDFQSVYVTIHNRLPMDGEILSRSGNDVTINVGRNWNLRNGDTVDAIQIIKIQRHPKHHFMVGAEKTILGKIKLSKVDDYLSFGKISFEKEPGTLRVDTKILAQRMISYPTGNEAVNDPSFGSNPSEWVPAAPPQFGKLQVSAGISQYNQNSRLQNYGSASASSNMTPTVRLDGEIWLNQEWFLQLSTMQAALTFSNPIKTDSPRNLNTTLSSYTAAAGYTWLLGPDFFGPKMQFSMGINQWISNPDQSAPTIAFSKMQFGGMFLGFNGSFNLAPGSPWDLGAQFKLYMTKNVSESPKSGSSSDLNMVDFSLYTKYRRSVRMAYVGQVIFENYSADFSGASSRPDPAEKTSHKNTQLLLGVEYAF